MQTNDWHILSDIEAGGVWAAVAEHPSVERLDRTHCGQQTTLGLWMSSEPNGSRGRFLTQAWRCGDAPLGGVVAVPAGFPLRVQAEEMPARRMLHCRLPERVALQADPAMLSGCIDMRNSVVASCLRRIAQETLTPGFGSQAIVEGLGLVIAGELERAMGRKSARLRKGGLAPWQLRRIDDHLRGGNWDSGVGEIARLCGVSTGHAMRAFRQSTGQSIAVYMAAMRIDRACTLLSRNDLPIGQIAAELRFASASAFAAAFRRVLGMSPNAYRQRRRSGDVAHPDPARFL